MPITGSDCAKAGELIRFLERVGFHELAAAFDARWNAEIEKQDEECADDDAVDDSARPRDLAHETWRRGTLEAPKSAKTADALKVLRVKHLVTSCLGRTADIYVDSEEKLAPSFPHGAGHSLETYNDIASEAVKMVPCHPYNKKPADSHAPIFSVPLKIMFQRGKTGLEPADEFPIVEGELVAARYRVINYLDSAAFSRTVSCLDEKTKKIVCLKIIRNSKENFDQSLDEIKLLMALNEKEGKEDHCILRLLDFFYFKEHLFLVTELLLDNLYVYGKISREPEHRPYFTLARIQAIARQVLVALSFLHSQDIIHCDLKPENILFKSYKKCLVKLIDFGSSCYITDSLGSYVQSRNYRSPEVILGCKYDTRIDIWSLGVIVPELATGKLLLNNESVPALLASMASVSGPIPAEMLHEGRNTPYFVTKYGAFYEKINDQVIFHFPTEVGSGKVDFGFDDNEYNSFVQDCLIINPKQRPSAKALLQHPFMKKNYGPVECEWESV